jgi:hypothetical protein
MKIKSIFKSKKKKIRKNAFKETSIKVFNPLLLKALGSPCFLRSKPMGGSSRTA